MLTMLTPREGRRRQLLRAEAQCGAAVVAAGGITAEAVCSAVHCQCMWPLMVDVVSG
jgi:phosphoribosylanthranilate isomerase